MAGFNLNSVSISGNLTRDPELRSLPNGTSICEIGVAVNERVKDQSGGWTDRANFFDVTIWSGLGEWVAANVRKGGGIAIQGRLRYESWEKDGQKRSKVKIVAEAIMPRDNGGQQAGGFEARPQAAQDFGAPVATGGGFGVPANDDDIPF